MAISLLFQVIYILWYLWWDAMMIVVIVVVVAVVIYCYQEINTIKKMRAKIYQMKYDDDDEKKFVVGLVLPVFLFEFAHLVRWKAMDEGRGKKEKTNLQPAASRKNKTDWLTDWMKWITFFKNFYSKSKFGMIFRS